ASALKPPDVLIVGAGVIGASVAWHLASRGMTNVHVIDRGREVGAGSTPRATGGYRAQFGTDINVRLSLLSREKLRRFEQDVGVDPGYRPQGYLFVASSQTKLDQLRAAQAIQHKAGLTEARMISAENVRELNPHIASGGIVGGAFCPSDGFIEPMAILNGYLTAAKRLGVRFEFGVPYTPKRSAPIMVNAAGAWAGEIAAIPITPLRRQVLPTVGTGPLTPDLPMTIFAEDAFHFRVRDDRVLLLWPGGAVPRNATDTTVDPKWLDHVERFTRERVPGLGNVKMDRAAAWAGLYDMSPDEHAILGRVGNMVFANGSSGHGVMHAPAIGQLVAEIILDGRAKTLDIGALRPSRFQEGKPIRGIEIF
ncbi:MAG TPA: FAD-dependent oxidoreductase, partial [Candidatus Thermoplasmatota archaeon]